MGENMSLSDIAAVTRNNDGLLGGAGGIWVLIILLFLVGGGSWFGNGERNATTADVQRATDFAALERQNNEGVQATRQGVYDVTSAIKDGNYNVLGELRDIQAGNALGFAQVNSNISDLSHQVQTCCCELKTMMLQDKYESVQSQLTEARGIINNQVQTNNILNSIGRFVTNPPVPCCNNGYGYGYYGYTGNTII